MDKKSSKNSKVIFSIISGILCIVFITLTFINLYKIDNKDIIVVEKVSVTSNVTNVLKQEYKSTFNGKIKNNTNNTLNNIEIVVNVKTNTLKHTGSFTYNIASLSKDEEFSLYKINETEENFETVESIKFKVGSGSFQEILNGKIFNFVSLLFLIPAILIGVICIKLLIPKKEVVSNQSVKASKSREQVLEDIIIKQQENESKRLELETQKVNLDISKIDIEKQKMENGKPIYCSYCGTKNDNKATNCSNCGSLLK